MVVLLAPGDQGAAQAGMHAPWVYTPLAAAVAAMVVGFEVDAHMAKVGIFVMDA